jgi:uncharacterized protein (UPF0303 family)
MAAQPYTLAELAAQEEELQYTSFTNDDALAFGLALVASAQAQAAPVAIEISRNGHQLFKVALPGATPDNDGWIARKSRVVQRFGHSSLYVRTQCEQDGTTLDGTYGLDPDEYAAHGGAFPIIVKNVGPVGIVVVSGLPQLEDHKLVTDVLRELLSR